MSRAGSKERRDGASGRFVYEWPRPAVTADVAVLRLGVTDPHSGSRRAAGLEVLLIQRDRPPFEGGWALPGGFVDRDEDLSHAATRELVEETRLRAAHIEQVGVVGTPKRDPRGHTVTALYTAATTREGAAAVAGDDARSAAWFAVDRLPPLAFDHRDLVDWVVLHWRDRLGRSPLLFDLVPRRFRAEEVRHAWRALGGQPRQFTSSWRAWRRAGAVGDANGAGRRLHLFRRSAFARFDPLAPRAGR